MRSLLISLLVTQFLSIAAGITFITYAAIKSNTVGGDDDTLGFFSAYWLLFVLYMGVMSSLAISRLSKWEQMKNKTAWLIGLNVFTLTPIIFTIWIIFFIL